MRHIVGWLWAFAWLGTLGGHARAQAPNAYALVIGSNRGGAGQGTLTYAQRDAERMASLLSELGRTPREHIERLSDPSAAEVQAALARIRERLARHAEAGEQSQLVFYYSGHARAHALSLGDDELALSTLRSALTTLPSTLTVVVLDACQSGAFSGVKGARAAADFSVSSVQNLHSSGIAVMASSTGTELSQESRELGSSYFTHHLLVALRGGGDSDGNGRVSLDEAYRYAYDRTLSDTARTQVGTQHATLETALTGRGDVPLTYPVDADAQLALPPELDGRVLVQREREGAVMAELVKARGAQLLLALPSGRYELLLRSDAARAESCSFTLTRGSVHRLQRAGCREVALPAHASKADGMQAPQDPRPPESWFLEVGIATHGRRDGAYVDTLHLFDYAEEDRDGASIGYDAGIGVGVNRYLQLALRGYKLDQRFFARPTTRAAEFMWGSHALTAGPRVRLPVVRHWVVLFAEATAGIGFARSELSDRFTAEEPKTHVERHYGFVFRAQAGVSFGFARHFGAYLAAGWVRAPVLANALGEAHDSGGFIFTNGLRLNGIEGWW